MGSVAPAPTVVELDAPEDAFGVEDLTANENAERSASESSSRVRRPRVVIVGAGFGGLSAAKELGGKAVDVTMVDRNNYHTFLPLLYQVATAGLEAESIVYPVRAI